VTEYAQSHFRISASVDVSGTVGVDLASEFLPSLPGTALHSSGIVVIMNARKRNFVKDPEARVARLESERSFDFLELFRDRGRAWSLQYRCTVTKSRRGRV